MMNTRLFYKFVTFFLISAALLFTENLPAQDNKIYINIRDYGVDGENVDADTRTVQSIVDSTSYAGGGTVYFPAGSYFLRTIVLKNNITVLLDRGATLLASTDMNEFKPEIRTTHTDPTTGKSKCKYFMDSVA